MKRILFYVSGHGFGHATRSAEVIRALGNDHPEIVVRVVTTAPQRIFADLPAVLGEVIVSEIGTGVVEGNSSLQIDRAATVARLARFIQGCDRIVEAETERIRREEVSLVVADIPYLAGEIAQRAGVPCAALGNFTWDWIYEPYLVESAEGRSLLARIRQAYAKMTCYLRLPFSHDTESIPSIRDIPLITRSVRTTPDHVLRKLGIDSNDQRGRILYAMRDSTYLHAVATAATAAPDRLFFYFGSPQGPMPSNARPVVLDGQMAFPDVLNVCDAVISKLGYGTMADCISTCTPILFPPRFDFREDEVFLPLVSKYLCARELPFDDFETGTWLRHLQELEKAPDPVMSLSMDGAAVCARILADMCRESGS